MYLETVNLEDLSFFQAMVERYWSELMPKSPVVQDSDRREVYFQQRFIWDGEHFPPCWAVVNGHRVGFLMLEVFSDRKQAAVKDFYVMPEERGRGYGTAMVQCMFSYLDKLGVEQIDLNVRSDNPGAFAFWQKQGFELALYRLRQYRDPKTNRALAT